MCWRTQKLRTGSKRMILMRNRRTRGSTCTCVWMSSRCTMSGEEKRYIQTRSRKADLHLLSARRLGWKWHKYITEQWVEDTSLCRWRIWIWYAQGWCDGLCIFVSCCLSCATFHTLNHSMAQHACRCYTSILPSMEKKVEQGPSPCRETYLFLQPIVCKLVMWHQGPGSITCNFAMCLPERKRRDIAGHN